MPSEDRWKKRYGSFVKSLEKLGEFVEYKQLESLTEIDRDSLIKRFELTFELSWNVLKDFLENQGQTGLYGSKNTFVMAFDRGITTDGETWMKMIESRILAAHVYDETNAVNIASKIYKEYYTLFNKLKSTLGAMLGG